MGGYKSGRNGTWVAKKVDGSVNDSADGWINQKMSRYMGG